MTKKKKDKRTNNDLQYCLCIWNFHSRFPLPASVFCSKMSHNPLIKVLYKMHMVITCLSFSSKIFSILVDWSIDWLIDWRLTSREQNISFINDSNLLCKIRIMNMWFLYCFLAFSLNKLNMFILCNYVNCCMLSVVIKLYFFEVLL
jgi:hypothetical protein